MDPLDVKNLSFRSSFSSAVQLARGLCVITGNMIVLPRLEAALKLKASKA